jgi:hypothetical protein
MSMHDTCKINIEDVRKCGCNCHHHTVMNQKEEQKQEH